MTDGIVKVTHVFLIMEMYVVSFMCTMYMLLFSAYWIYNNQMHIDYEKYIKVM